MIRKRKKKAKYRWLKVGFFENNKFVEGWVREDNLRDTEPRIISIDKKVIFSYRKINEDLFSEKIVNPCKDDIWINLGGGDYPHICPIIDGRLAVAVGPEIIEENYNKDGKCQDEELFSFSKIIRVHLINSKDKMDKLEVEFHVVDIKVHTYAAYNYDEIKNFPNKAGFQEASANVKINKTEKTTNIKNGLIQTGMRYPKATNGYSMSKFGDMTGSVIELCGAKLSKPGYYEKLRSYELDYIETNFESDTRGKGFRKDVLRK